MHRLISSLLSAGLLLLMAACGSSGAGDLAGFRIPDVRTTVDGEGEAFGVAFLMVDATALVTSTTASLASTGSELAPLGMTEIQEGVYLGQLADIDSAGNTTFNLPLPEEIPSGTIVDATAAFLNVNSAPDCSVLVEPAGVQMSVNAFELLAIPGFVGLAVTPSNSTLSLALLSDQFLDLDALPSAVRVYQWIYSDGQAVVSFAGGDCGFISASGVEFQSGWNLIGWDIEASTGEMVNVERPETLFLTIQGDPPAP